MAQYVRPLCYKYSMAVNSIEPEGHNPEVSGVGWSASALLHCKNKTVILTQLLCCLSCKYNKLWYGIFDIFDAKMISHK